MGIGGLGSLAAQFAKALGYMVVAIDNRSEGRELAQEAELKTDLVVDFNDKDAAEKIRNLVGEGGLASILCTTDSQEAITWSLGALRTRGTLVEIGLPVEHIKFDSFDFIFQEKTIKSSLVATKSQVSGDAQGSGQIWHPFSHHDGGFGPSARAAGSLHGSTS